MTRPDANLIALRAVRTILDAAHDFTFVAAGKTISVTCLRGASVWPPSAEGLDAVADAPWPAPITLAARWESGASRLVLACEVWSPHQGFRNAVSISVSIPSSHRQILWITLALALSTAADGESVPILGSLKVGKRHDDENVAAYTSFTAAVRTVVQGVGVPFRTQANAQLGSVEIPGGAVTPDAPIVFEQCAMLAIVKHAWCERRERLGFEGVPFIEVPFTPNDGAETSGIDADEISTSPDGKRAGIWPLPGGVRNFMSTLRTLLRDVAERQPMSVADLDEIFAQRYQVFGRTTRTGYRIVLRNLGFLAQNGDQVEVTEAGQAWLANPNARALFEVLHAEYSGILELLVLAELMPRLPRARVLEVLREVLDTNWQTGNQVNFRRDWLLSLGLTDRTHEGEVLTPAGAAVLSDHAEEAEQARVAIREALASLGLNPTDGPEEDDGGEDSAPVVATTVEPSPRWLAEHLDLKPETIAAQLGSLRIEDRVIQQLAAAVSSGKHVLFVGPPGTGKTELAVALTRAAKAEGYCAGLFTATASADWTTFDTIGGYAMQKDQTLAFRPGAFLRAIHEHKWLLVGELNRADVDRAFGELMTVLAGQGTDTHYELSEGKRVSIGHEVKDTYRVPRSFRVLATMNIWDKTSLFRLSYAVQRRFALVHVGLPSDATYEAILAAAADDGVHIPPLAPAHRGAVTRLFSTAGLLSVREIGPAVGLDVVRYLRYRGGVADGIAEAIEMFVLPQLQGLGDRAAKEARGFCLDAVGNGASAQARDSLKARFRELFPSLGAIDD